MKKETVTGKYGKQSGKNKNIYYVYGRAHKGTQEVGQDRIASPLKRLKIVFGDDHFLQGGHAIRERVMVIEYALGDKAADQGEPGEE